MINLSNIRHIHFIGIGGIMMSGIAELLKNNDYIITGSDLKESDITNHLINQGIKIYFKHEEDNVEGADLVVYSSAVNENNPELKKALKDEIKILNRAEMVGVIMKEYSTNIAISGAHGKTTTTSMVSEILNYSKMNPTVLIGGISNNIHSNVQIGSSDIFLLEACEYKENFLHFNHNIGVILNIDEDHLDYYKDLNHIIDAFIKFANKIPEEGYLVVNSDDYNARKVLSHVNCNVLTFGINDNSDFTAKNIIFDNNGYPTFDVFYQDTLLDKFSLNVPGKHNIYDALSSIVVSYILKMDIKKVKEALVEYKGTKRRFDYIGSYHEASIFDDYAHHPNEIKATLEAAKKISHNRIISIFQPHTYSRTNSLLLEFSSSFKKADLVIITDIYAAREKKDLGVHSKDLVREIDKVHDNVIYLSEFDEVVSYLKEHIEKDDIVLTMGAGNIREVAQLIVEN